MIDKKRYLKGEMGMGMTKKAREYQEKMGTDMLSALLETLCRLCI